MNKHEHFLSFNGKNIIYVKVDKTYFIAFKSLCEALNIEYSRSFKNAKNDPILGSVLAVQPMQVAKNGKKQHRKVSCIPEKYVYGWLFSVRSDSAELLAYKRTCYELLYNHFHGTITNRKELLMQREEVDNQIGKLKQQLKEKDESFKTLQQLQNQRKEICKQLNTIDDELVKQPTLF